MNYLIKLQGNQQARSQNLIKSLLTLEVIISFQEQHNHLYFIILPLYNINHDMARGGACHELCHENRNYHTMRIF